MNANENNEAPDSFTDAAAQQSIGRAFKFGVVIALLALPVCWWKTGWQGAVGFAIGAAVSLSGILEWRRMMTVLMARMAVAEAAGAPQVQPRAVTPVVVGFLVRLALAAAALYVSLKYLNSSVIAVAVGLAVGVTALLIEAVRLLKSWTE